MMKKTLLALGILGLSSWGHSAIHLSYDGSVIPASPTWSMTSGSSVTTQVVTDGSRQVLKITDVGNGVGKRFLNITSPLSVDQGNDLFSTDWEYKITLKIPGFDDQSTDAWDVSANMFTSLVRDLGGNVRHMYALHLGRNAQGQTQIKSATQSPVMLLNNDYHEIKVTYSKETNTTKIFINGNYWQDMTPSITTGSGGYFTFGDNNDQGVERPDRWFFVDDVYLKSVPEPSRALLLILGVSAGLLRRKRLHSGSIV